MFRTTLLLAAVFTVGCGSSDPDPKAVSNHQARQTPQRVCDSVAHETTSLGAGYRFDLDCAVAYLKAAGCDWTLDPDGDGEHFATSTIEDMHNDPASCQTGGKCSGCDDADTIDTIGDCEAMAGFAYFTESEWKDLAAICPIDDELTPPATGCLIEGVSFSGDEATCARQLFVSMSCDDCVDLFDSRVCEDAVNDPATCTVGASCTGCDDGDGRDNGVTCEEIAAYSYFGPVAAQKLLDQVRADPCETCTPSCDGRTCGDDGCGGTCGVCIDGEVCEPSGQCVLDGCTIDGVYFHYYQMECALTLFEGLDCETCRSVFDSRVCEDAINDAAMCAIGETCTGCGDEDGISDGVSCDEIAAYSYFGAAAAQELLEYVTADPTCGVPDFVIEGVPLFAAQANAIVGLANAASLHQLDEEAGLDARAANNLVAGRPFATIELVADVSYVGTSAIEKLRDYAVIWTGAPPEPPDVDEDTDIPDDDDEEECLPQLLPAQNQAAVDFSQLMALTTTVDAPFSEVEVYTVSACSVATWRADAYATEVFTAAAWNVTYVWNWNDLTDRFKVVHPFADGGDQFLGLLDTSLQSIDEHLQDGDFDPADPAISALYGQRQALRQTLAAGVLANPDGFIELRFEADMLECSEDAVALVDEATGLVIIVHEFPHC